jgi:hypothetical protein
MPRFGDSSFVISLPRMQQTIPGMQAKRLLASGGVTMAAGAMLSMSFAFSPPLTLLPPRPTPADVGGNVTSQQQHQKQQQKQTVETVGAAVADSFEGRWQAATDVPLLPVPQRDPLEGLIGGTLFEPHDLAVGPQPEQQDPVQQEPVQQEPVKVALQEPATRPSDVCARHGLRRVDYTQNRHRYWRCAAQR